MNTSSTNDALLRRAEQLRNKAEDLREEADCLEREADEIEADLGGDTAVPVEIRGMAESILYTVSTGISGRAIDLCERALSGQGDEILQREIAALWQNFGAPDFNLPESHMSIDPKDFIFPSHE